LMKTARNRAIDMLRRNKRLAITHAALGYEADTLQAEQSAVLHDSIDDDIGDDLLRLIFTACHPLLSPEARAAMTLRLLGGLTTEEIARAFLVPTPTMAARITRAKKALVDAHVGFDAPRDAERAERMDSVLEVIYLIFNEGYAATASDDWMRPELCADALRLGRVLAQIAPVESEVHGLVALMEIQASRTAARTGPDGTPILLLEQDRSKWDPLLIRRGLDALQRVESLGGSDGRYALQASIAACHAVAHVAADTDWPRIAALYDRLAQQAPSPVIELNRAVAHGMAFGPAGGLALVDMLVHAGTLDQYHFLPSARGDFLFKLGRFDEARGEFERAAALTRNGRERTMLLARAADCRTTT
jgi:RNA polymerase sigma-70 factor, ECF subfamily